MSVLSAAATIGVLLLEHADVIADVAEAIANGSPKEALKSAIRGVQLATSRAAILEELGAAEDRREHTNYGFKAYEAYAKSMGGKTFDGREMPTWLELPERIRLAWEAAADAARE